MPKVHGESALWILQNARECAGDPALRSQAAFAREMGVHRAQINRWESGQVALSHQLVRRYEDALGLPSHQLLMAMELLRPKHLHPRVALALPPPPAADPQSDASDLLDAALSNERMTPYQWERLSALIMEMPRVLVRQCDWESLLLRLTTEHTMSRGLAYLLINEAGARLASHPKAASIILQLVDEQLANGGRPLHADVTDFVLYADTPQCVDVLVKHLQHPSSESALSSVMGVLTTLARAGALSESQRRLGVACALAVVRDPVFGVETRREAATLLSGATGSDRRRVATMLAGTSPRPAREDIGVVLEGSALAATQRRQLIGRALDAVAGDGLRSEHPVFTHLVGVGLTDPHDGARGVALGTLHLTPQGQSIGRATARLVAEARSTDPTFVREVLPVLGWLTPVSEFDSLTEFMLDPAVSAPLAYRAAVAIGNSPQPANGAERLRDARLAAYARATIASRRESLPGIATGGPGHGSGRPSGHATANARGVCYVLGMRGRFDILERLAREPGARRDPQWGPCLSWWLSIPEYSRPAIAEPDTDQADEAS